MTTINKPYYVYRHYIGDNTFYVGSNYKRANEKRAWSKNGRNEVWKDIVSSNSGRYDVEILEYFDNKEEALEYEAKVQEYYWSINQCKASLQHSPNARKKISNANSGEKNGMYGKSLSKESIESIREKAKKRIKSKEEREKLRIANLGKTIPLETRDKISKSVSESKKKQRTLTNEETKESLTFNSVTEARNWMKDNLSIGRHVQNGVLYQKKEINGWKLTEV